MSDHAGERLPDDGVWTYAITEEGNLRGADGEVDLSWLFGVGEAKVRPLTCHGLTALVSDVSLAEFGEAALRRNMENLDWLNEVAREHHYVIDAAGRLFPLLPIRLATVYSGDGAVCAALASRRDGLRAALRRVSGRVEWGVKAYSAAERDAGGPVKAEPDRGAGLAYLKRRRAQLAADRGSRVAAVNEARAVHADLSVRAAGARLRPPQSAQLSGARLPMLLNAAYLVEEADGVSFTATVAGHAAAHPELRIELTGPWPPYSFADDGDDDDGH